MKENDKSITKKKVLKAKECGPTFPSLSPLPLAFPQEIANKTFLKLGDTKLFVLVVGI